MTRDAVTTAVRTIDERVSVIDIAGELTAACEASLMQAYGRASGERTQAVVLNFGALDYMNSTGIGLLVTLLVRARRQDQRLLACGLSEHYREIFEVTRLDEAVEIHDAEDDALAAASARAEGRPR